MSCDLQKNPGARRGREAAAAVGDEAPSVPEVPERKSFHDWLEVLNAKSAHKIVIRDFDGLDRGDFERAYRGTPMTERDFQRRLARCTFNIKV